MTEFSDQLLEAPTARVIEARRSRYDAGTTLTRAGVKLLVAVLVIWALFSWVFGLFRVQGNSMRPTAGDGDLVLTSRVIDSLKSDDLVVYQEDGKQALVRVVAQPGDTVEITDDGQLKVNGNAQASVTQGSTSKGSGTIAYPITLGEGQYFVLNDNRDSTSDSREYGAVGLTDIQGKVIALLRIREI
ncbi:MAG: signal peptidase I [Atopobiaceae bacterium]